MADATLPTESNEPAPPVKKRSLFTKSTTHTQLSEAEQAVEFFSRAKEIFPDRVAEDERRWQKKIAKLERKNSTASVERKDSVESGSKRRRISSPEDDGNQYHSGGSPELSGSKGCKTTQRASTHSTPSKRAPKFDSEVHSSPTGLVGRYTRDLQAKAVSSTPKKGEASKGYISLSDSDELGGNAHTKPIVLDDDDDDFEAFKVVRPVQVEEDPQISDEEFPELVARARERETQKLLGNANLSRAAEAQGFGSQGGVIAAEDIFQSRYESLSEADPTIELLITSEMDGTNPLKVRRRLSQRLKEVRLSWCDKQLFNGMPMNTAVKDRVFFTWKGIRLYDYTTCRSLGFNQTRRSGGSLDGSGFDSDGRVHLEAWTEELHTAYEQMREKEKFQEENGIEHQPEEKGRDQTEKIRLILVDRESKELKIVVKTTTLLAKLISAFRADRGLDESREVSLHFDGDKLDPGMAVKDADLASMDRVEVHVK